MHLELSPCLQENLKFAVANIFPRPFDAVPTAGAWLRACGESGGWAAAPPLNGCTRVSAKCGLSVHSRLHAQT